MATSARSNGARYQAPQRRANGRGLGGGWDETDNPENDNETIRIVVGPADNEDVQKLARVGGVTIDPETGETITGRVPAKKKPESTSFNANLALKLDEMVLAQIAMDLLEGIEADIQSRQQQITTYNDNMDLLGLKIERGGNSGADGQTVSNVRHPVLLESVVKFQSAAGSEMLPADGPAKVINDGDDSTQEDEVAEALEQDINWYLTRVATEYAAGTDRANFYLGYGGTIFKKVYKCPVRRRPVSEPVYIPDLIVSNDATDLTNALRITHVLRYNRGQVKQMQAMKIWRKVDMAEPVSQPSTTQQKEGNIIGITPQINRQKDIPREIYECYCLLWLGEWDEKADEPGQEPGQPIPYRVTIDKVSQKVLEIRRDWKQGDEMFQRKRHFIKFGLVPGLGFYDLGFLHLIGNQTKQLTAIWRILVDAGMFNNFPGGVMIKGARIDNNIIRPNPGEWVPVQTGPQQDITKAFMPLPYKEPSPVLLQMAEIIGQDAQRMGSAVELETGEGRTNIPVGTIMAQIEQQTQILQAVHKRLHRAQEEELTAILDLFRDDPKALWKFFGDKKPAYQWQTGEEFNNRRLVPASDPNVPAQIHRIMMAVAISMLAQQNPQIYDQLAVNKRVLSMINVKDVDDLLMTAQKQQQLAESMAGLPPPPPDPKIIAAQIQQQSKQAEIASKQQGDQLDLQADAMKAGADIHQRQLESADRQADRVSREKTEMMKIQQQAMKDAADRANDEREMHMQEQQHHQEMQMAQQDHQMQREQHEHDKAMDQAGLVQQQQQMQHDQHMAEGGMMLDQQDQQHRHSVEERGLASEQEHFQHEKTMDKAGLAGERQDRQHQQRMDRRAARQQDRSLDNDAAATKAKSKGLNGTAGGGLGSTVH